MSSVSPASRPYIFQMFSNETLTIDFVSPQRSNIDVMNLLQNSQIFKIGES